MLEFNSTLLREKFSILDSDPESGEENAIIATSNRFVVELKGNNAKQNETFVIRTHNMHSCVRMAARLIKSYQTGGPILTRGKSYDWEAAWDITVNDYEYRYNEERWVAVYNNGKVIYEYGERNPLLDVIEKCDARNKGKYEDSLLMAEDAFKQAGKIVKIKHDTNVALVVDLMRFQGKCGVIIRGPTRTTTFNFSVASTDNKEPINFAQVLSVCACFLEGVQLAFMLGMNHEKIRLGMFEPNSKEEKQTREGGRRLGRLNVEVTNLERVCTVRYRPEKPDFQLVLTEAERLAQQVIKAPEKKVGEPEQAADDND